MVSVSLRFWNSNQKDRFCPLSASKRTAGAYLKDAKVLAKVKTTPMDDKTKPLLYLFSTGSYIV